MSKIKSLIIVIFVYFLVLLGFMGIAIYALITNNDLRTF